MLLSTLNTMSGYEIAQSDVNNHRLVEATKVGPHLAATSSSALHLVLTLDFLFFLDQFAYGQRTILGDPEFLHNITTLSKKFLLPSTGETLRSRINDKRTHDSEWYNPDRSAPFATAHTHNKGVINTEVPEIAWIVGTKSRTTPERLLWLPRMSLAWLCPSRRPSTCESRCLGRCASNLH